MYIDFLNPPDVIGCAWSLDAALAVRCIDPCADGFTWFYPRLFTALECCHQNLMVCNSPKETGKLETWIFFSNLWGMEWIIYTMLETLFSPFGAPIRITSNCYIMMI